MELAEVMQLNFERFGSFQLLWSFYITVVLGVVAYVGVSSGRGSSALVRVLVAVGFLLFAVANLYALDRVSEQRRLLAANALAVVERTYSSVELRAATQEAERWRSIINSNKPPEKPELFVFHAVCSTLVIGVIWVVPGLLVSRKKILSLDSAAVAVARSPFPPAAVSRDQGKGVWRLESQYELAVGGFDFRIPRNFEFDLASVPKPLWWLIAPFELSVTAPLVHDFIYAHHGALPEGTVTSGHARSDRISRSEADGLFLDIMRLEGVSWLRRTLAYLAVRLVGELFWKSPEVTNPEAT